MPRRFEMSVLRTRCQRRADLENDGHISDAEWNALISEKYGELYGVVCGAGLRYFETTSAITANGAASYDEPDDHLSTIGLDFISTAGERRRLHELMPFERDNYVANGATGEARGYTLVDNKIYLFPTPASGSYQLIYVPQPPDLSSYLDTDLVDVVSSEGEAFLIWGVCVLAKSKSESDVRLAAEREEAARDRLLEWAVNRSMSEPRRRPDPNWGWPARSERDL